ncbi:MAG: hypothetical protein P1T08_04895 [Acidimicrobiia bacterium]|nr:hypothetical protein [Acidimicrobiia bacterium]
MTIVFLILVLYGLFFFLLAMTDEGAGRRPSKTNTNRHLVAPISLPGRNNPSPEAAETTELAV